MSASAAISAIIPVYNGERHLSEAIESVLGQTLAPSEIVVVDDGSDDATPAVARRYGSRVRFRRQRNQGAAAARNTGVGMAAGTFVAFLDADDLWMPEKLARQLRTFEAQPELDMVFCLIQEFVSVESQLTDSARQPEARQGAMLPSGLMIRRTSFERVGPFSTEFEVGEFIDWYARAMDAGLRMATVPEELVRRRIHGANQGIRKRHLYQREYLRVLKKTRDRRRTRDSGN